MQREYEARNQLNALQNSEHQLKIMNGKLTSQVVSLVQAQSLKVSYLFFFSHADVPFDSLTVPGQENS
jgi:hypothetical protein